MIITTPKKYPFSIFDLGVFAHILSHRNPDGRFTGSEENLAKMYPSDNRSEEARRKAVNRSIFRWLNLECLKEDVPSRPRLDGLGGLPKIVHPTCTLIELLDPTRWTLSSGRGGSLSSGQNGQKNSRLSSGQSGATADNTDTKQPAEDLPCPAVETTQNSAPCPAALPWTPSASSLTTNGSEYVRDGSGLMVKGSSGDVQRSQSEFHEHLRVLRETLVLEEATRATMAHPNSAYWTNKIRNLQDDISRLEAQEGQ